MNYSEKFFIILGLELILTAFYTYITPKNKQAKLLDFKSIFKGLLERGFLTYSLLSGFPHVLTLFGALKLGTRLKHGDVENTKEGRKKETIYNDYYLIGNFVSVALSIYYFNLLNDLD